VIGVTEGRCIVQSKHYMSWIHSSECLLRFTKPEISHLQYNIKERAKYLQKK
jgi:hypothetical protein